jgi:hypothetical protein
MNTDNHFFLTKKINEIKKSPLILHIKWILINKYLVKIIIV